MSHPQSSNGQQSADHNSADVRTTSLHAWHVAAGAKMVDFAGWDMPIEYPMGTVGEHRTVRAGCGVFDVSHMGTVRISGAAALAELNELLTNDLDRLAVGQVQYTLMCDDNGGVIDDMLATRLAADEVLVVPNAANTAAVLAELHDAIADSAIHDESAATSLIAVQGPQSAEALIGVGLSPDLPYMTAELQPYRTGQVLVSRTGYTGEPGFELILPNELAVTLWEQLVDRPEVAPCGLGARDTLRTEMGYPLHGQDISAEIDPVAARLSWAIAWDTEFRGKAALQQIKDRGANRVLRGLLLQGRGVPRPGMAVRQNGATVGAVTSGTFSPSLRQGIALALLDSSITPGDAVAVDIRGREVAAGVVSPPFVESSPR